jgi:hypothetical protein
MSNDIPNQQELVKTWSKTANALLSGFQLRRAYYMPAASVEAMGWHASSVVIELFDPNGDKDDIRLFPMQDDEGNNAGALATSDKEDPVLPVIWKK